MIFWLCRESVLRPSRRVFDLDRFVAMPDPSYVTLKHLAPFQLIPNGSVVLLSAVGSTFWGNLPLKDETILVRLSFRLEFSNCRHVRRRSTLLREHSVVVSYWSIFVNV